MKDRDGLVRGAIVFLYLFDSVFGAVAVAICWASAFQSYPSVLGPLLVSESLRVALLIPGCSTAGPLRVFNSRGLEGRVY